MAHLSKSGGMLSGPVARPFLSFNMACMTSAGVGSFVEIYGTTLACYKLNIDTLLSHQISCLKTKYWCIVNA